jgi:uncharacterized protein
MQNMPDKTLPVITLAHSKNLVIYFTCVFGMTWLLQLLVILNAYHLFHIASQLTQWLYGTSFFAPTDVALVMILYQFGITGIRNLWCQLQRWRVYPAWYVIAIFLPTLLVLIAVKLNSLLAGTPTLFHWPQPSQSLATVIVPTLGEELGWRGFALPRLQWRFSALRASLILGVIWGVWHLPIFFLLGASLKLFPLFVLGVIAESVILTWIYNSTGNSLLIILLAHAGVDLGLRIISSLPTDNLSLPLLITLTFCLVAFSIVFITGPQTLCRYY